MSEKATEEVGRSEAVERTTAGQGAADEVGASTVAPPRLPKLVLRTVAGEHNSAARFHRQWIDLKAEIEADISRLRDWWLYSSGREQAEATGRRITAADAQAALDRIGPLMGYVVTELDAVDSELGSVQDEIDEVCQSEDESRSQRAPTSTAKSQ